MKWVEIRDHYAMLYERAQRAGVTQQEIADRGGLCGQNAISKLLRNARLGPCVETLVGAIEGLGLTVPEFFLGLGAGASVSAHDDPGLDEQALAHRVAAIELQLTALQEAVYQSARAALASAPEPHVAAPVAAPRDRDRDRDPAPAAARRA